MRVVELVRAVHASARALFGERIPTLTDAPSLVVVWPDKASSRRFARRHLDGPLRFFRNWRARHIRREVSLPALFGASLAAVRADDHRHLVGLGRHLLVFLHEKGRLIDYVAALDQHLSANPKDHHLASLESLAAVWPDFELDAFTRDLVRWLR